MRSGIVAGLAALALVAASATGTANAQAVDHVIDQDGWRYTLTATPVTSPAIDTGMAAAAAYWGRLPNCPDLGWYAMYAETLAPVWVEAADPRALALAELNACRRWISAVWLESAPAARDVCAVVVHEIGHNLGYDHAEYSDDPLSLMMSEDHGYPASCEPAKVGERRRFSRKQDRTWCKRNRSVCTRKYPKLAKRIFVKRPADLGARRLVARHEPTGFQPLEPH